MYTIRLIFCYHRWSFSFERLNRIKFYEHNEWNKAVWTTSCIQDNSQAQKKKKKKYINLCVNGSMRDSRQGEIYDPDQQ